MVEVRNFFIEIVKNDMKAKYFILIVIIFTIMIRSFISFVNGRAKKAEKEVSFSGIITKLYRIPMQHDMRVFDVQTEYGEIGVTADNWWYLWEFASVGDSIIKPPDTLMVIIKKPDGRSKEFFYRDSKK